MSTPGGVAARASHRVPQGCYGNVCGLPSAALRSADGYKLGLYDWRFDSRFPAPHAYACDSSYLEYTPILIASFSDVLVEISYFLATRPPYRDSATISIDNFCNMLPMVRVLGSTVTTVDALIRRGGEDGPRSEALALNPEVARSCFPSPARKPFALDPRHRTRYDATLVHTQLGLGGGT